MLICKDIIIFQYWGDTRQLLLTYYNNYFCKCMKAILSIGYVDEAISIPCFADILSGEPNWL